MVDRLLDAAEELLEAMPHSAAFRRRAVSTCYYAVFHALAKVCVETLLPSVPRDSDEYLRVYRSLDHGPLRNAFGQPPIKDHPQLKGIAPTIIHLQNERHRADYLPPDKNLFSADEVRELADQARLIIREVENLDPASRRMLATCLLFKERKS
jgi:hypothetical protein